VNRVAADTLLDINMARDESGTLTMVLGWRALETSPGLTVSLTCEEAPGGSSHHPLGLISGAVALTVGGTASTSFLCFGYDVSEFASQLERLHRDLKGMAEFINQESTVRIAISVADPRRGRLAVGGEIEFPYFPATDNVLVGMLSRPGARLTFDGLACEQSFLPGFVHDIRQFLRSSRVSLEHPML
jgi:hypothetical protein